MRKRIFRLIAVAFPFVLLLGTEGVCRLAGYGGYPPIIRRAGGADGRVWWATNRAGTDTFFQRQAGGTGGMREVVFTTPKTVEVELQRTGRTGVEVELRPTSVEVETRPTGVEVQLQPTSDVVRIGLFGDSAMQGYPQPLPLTNGAFLEAMLNDAWVRGAADDTSAGARQAQVLNFGCTAVASFVSLHILEAALEHDLDLAVIMAGNNEFFGAYGVASVHRAGTSPAGMHFMRWTRHFALPQWLDDLWTARPETATGQKQVLMERVAAVGQIGVDDPLREAARNVISDNLRRMVEAATRRGVPVILCTLPTNERGLRPIGVDLDPAGGANVHYRRGEELAAKGDAPSAAAEFVAARDADTMPWRATSATNDAIRAVARDAGVTLCDMEAAFRAASEGGAIGWELMDDHVHMSLRGQALFAGTLIRTMAGTAVTEGNRRPVASAPGSDGRRGYSDGRRGNARGDWSVSPERVEALPAWDVYAARLGANPRDAWSAAYHMKLLFDAEFMVRSNPEAQTRAQRRLSEIEAALSATDRNAAAEWSGGAARHMAADRPINAVAGLARLRAGDHAGAAECFRMARRCVCDISLWRVENTVRLMYCLKRGGEGAREELATLRGDALRTIELLKRLANLPERTGQRWRGLALAYAGDYSAAVPCLEQAVAWERGREGLEVVQALALSLTRTGATDRARELLKQATRDDGMRDAASKMLRALSPADENQPAEATGDGPGDIP